jgi:hypothetical protein
MNDRQARLLGLFFIWVAFMLGFTWTIEPLIVSYRPHIIIVTLGSGIYLLQRSYRRSK